MQKKNRFFISEHYYYFLLFVLVSLFYIMYGYASLGTNDDWALWGMLKAKGIYGTLIMSYPLSYIMSHLYDLFPRIPWYSVLIASIMAIHFYFLSIYIAKQDSLLRKLLMLIFALLWMTYIWFNASITILTVATMITAVGLLRDHFLLSIFFVFVASLLRLDIAIITLPYYIVAFFILRKTLHIKQSEAAGILITIFLIFSSVYIQNQDQSYTQWLKFNKARAAIVDMGILDVDKDYFTPNEQFCIAAGWWQDEELLPSDKIIATTPPLKKILQQNVKKLHFFDFIKAYKFKEWLWLLLAVSAIAILLNLRNRKGLFLLFLSLGVLLLLITRDVDRVTIPMIYMWAFILYETLRPYQKFRTIFLLMFVVILYYYESPLLGYRYYKENTALQKEAQELIKKSAKVYDVSINYPTAYSNELTTIFIANYLFHEDNWMPLNDKEILPGGWLSRHPFFYQSHHISDTKTKRKYTSYRDFLVDKDTAFFGGKFLVKDKSFKVNLLKKYDDLYLKNRPGCVHKTVIINQSKHFAISQIKVVCMQSQKKEK